MKRGKFDAVVSIGRLRSIQILMGVLFLYVVFVSLEIPLVLKTGLVIGLGSADIDSTASMVTRPINEGEIATDEAHVARSSILQRSALRRKPERRIRELKKISRLVFDEKAFVSAVGSDFSELHNAAMHAFTVGKKVWEEIESGKVSIEMENSKQNGTQSCPNSISLFKDDFEEKSGIVVIPCGLTLGSHITVVGKPGWAHPEEDSSISRDGEEKAMVSQFFMELQGLKTVDGEDPPRILHFNPRLKGDWSGRPVIEQNTCYRMQWGSSMRCEGWKSKADEETVDGQVKCERWIRDDDNKSEESKTIWWLKRLIGRTKKVTVDWPYPFAEGKLFVLTLRAGLEGYHVNVNGRHVTSFPYRPGFTLEDATGLSLKGDIDVHSVYAASLPMSHSSFAPQRHLEMAMKWQAPPLPDGSVELFIGVLSAGNHFAERMAVRKSWMQHESIKSSNVVARFFVALHGRKGVNLELIKEAEYFGDIIIVPYIDNYDLVVLKTLAICEFGVRSVAAKYIMKCDDDTFVRIDSVMKEAKAAHNGGRSLYVGNMNYYHKPLRHGKWAVTYQEWPEEHYPPYANGPGYVVSADIAEYIVSEFQRHKLRLFKMEDVSMGMWVEQFNSSTSRLGRSGVEYVHSLKFCQFGCIEDYYTAHYQSPRQMICLWNKLLQHQSNPRCCNMR